MPATNAHCYLTAPGLAPDPLRNEIINVLINLSGFVEARRRVGIELLDPPIWAAHTTAPISVGRMHGKDDSIRQLPCIVVVPSVDGAAGVAWQG